MQPGPFSFSLAVVNVQKCYHAEPHSFDALLHLASIRKGYRRRIILACTCSALNTFFDVMPEILIGIAIDVVVNQEASFVARLGFRDAKVPNRGLGLLTFIIWVGESLFEYPCI